MLINAGFVGIVLGSIDPNALLWPQQTHHALRFVLISSREFLSMKILIMSSYRRFIKLGPLTPELSELGLAIAPECWLNHLFQWKRTELKLLTSGHLTNWIEHGTWKEHLNRHCTFRRVTNDMQRRASVVRKSSNTEKR